MCLITYRSPIKILKKDMIVFKVLRRYDNLLTSIYKGNFMYELGKLYKTEIKEIDPIESTPSTILFADGTVSKYFRNRYDKIDSAQGMIAQNPELVAYGPGFHSIKKVIGRLSYLEANTVLVQCTLPAGTRYYEDPVEGIVSDRIIIDNIIAHNVTDTYMYIADMISLGAFPKTIETSNWEDYSVFEKEYDTLQDMIQNNPQDYTS